MRQRRHRNNGRRLVIAALLSAAMILALCGDKHLALASSKESKFISLKELNEWTLGGSVNGDNDVPPDESESGLVGDESESFPEDAGHFGEDYSDDETNGDEGGDSDGEEDWIDDSSREDGSDLNDDSEAGEESDGKSGKTDSSGQESGLDDSGTDQSVNTDSDYSGGEEDSGIDGDNSKPDDGNGHSEGADSGKPADGSDSSESKGGASSAGTSSKPTGITAKPTGNKAKTTGEIANSTGKAAKPSLKIPSPTSIPGKANPKSSAASYKGSSVGLSSSNQKRDRFQSNLNDKWSLTEKVVRTTGKKVKGLLKVRAGKGDEFPLAGTIQKGGVFFLIEWQEGEEWSFIETADSNNHFLRGYVKTQLITDKNAEMLLKKYGNRYGKYVTVMRGEQDNEAFKVVKKTVYEEIVKAHEETVKAYEEVASEETSDEMRNDLVQYALQFLGNPYIWGGESLTEGCDCSGFTMQVYRHFGIELPRCSFEQAECGARINPHEALPGDMLFYSRYGEVYHVLIYIGAGMAVNASSSLTGIIISSVDYDKTCWGVNVMDGEAS